MALRRLLGTTDLLLEAAACAGLHQGTPQWLPHTLLSQHSMPTAAHMSKATVSSALHQEKPIIAKITQAYAVRMFLHGC